MRSLRSGVVRRPDDADPFGAQAPHARLAEQPHRRAAVDQVGRPDEAGDERRRRVLVDVGGGPDLLDDAGVEDRDPVAHRQRLLLVVRHEDEGDADVALDRLELDLHLLAQLEVQGAERLVQQQHPRLG